MNDLSWLLYWADVLPSLATSLSVSMVFVTVILATVTFLGLVIANMELATKRDEEIGGKMVKAGRWIILSSLLWGASFFIPSKDTIYMIAASEAGEQVLQTPEFGKVRTIINQYLDGKIENKTEEKKEI